MSRLHDFPPVFFFFLFCACVPCRACPSCRRFQAVKRRLKQDGFLCNTHLKHAFRFYFERIFHAHQKVVALKTCVLVYFVPLKRFFNLLNISMLYYICSVVHKTLFFLYSALCSFTRLKLREHTFSPSCQNKRGYFT